MLWNRWDEVRRRAAHVRDAVRRRFYTVVDAAGLDEDRARDWVVVRDGAQRDVDGPGRRATPTGRSTPRTASGSPGASTIAKAVQD